MFPPRLVALHLFPSINLAHLSREILLHILLLLLVSWLTFFSYQRVPPTTIHVEGDQGVGFRGFYEAEHTKQFTFRWSSGVGNVCFDRYSYGPMDDVSLTLLGHGAVPLGITTVTLLANDRPIASVPLRPARQHMHFVVATAGQDRGELCITLLSETAQQPGDDR